MPLEYDSEDPLHPIFAAYLSVCHIHVYNNSNYNWFSMPTTCPWRQTQVFFFWHGFSMANPGIFLWHPHGVDLLLTPRNLPGFSGDCVCPETLPDWCSAGWIYPRYTWGTVPRGCQWQLKEWLSLVKKNPEQKWNTQSWWRASIPRGKIQSLPNEKEAKDLNIGNSFCFSSFGEWTYDFRGTFTWHSCNLL